MECVRRSIAVEVENPLPELYALEEQYRRIVEEVVAYVAERGTLKKKRYKELYQRFRKQYRLPAQLIQQAMNQGVEIGKPFLEAKRDGRIRRSRPEVRQVAIRFAVAGASRRLSAPRLPSGWRRLSPAGRERFGL
jgi:putative transposase